MPGDGVALAAILKAPPSPAIAGGYNSARAAYFQNVSATGFGVKTPVSYAPSIETLRETLDRRVVILRYTLSRYIQSRSPPSTTGLQAALLTGDRSAIPKAQDEVLRDAGLAHMLAISGLHMGLLAGGAYALASFVLACISPLAGRYDMRKWAAFTGIILATIYLIFIPAPVFRHNAPILWP